MSDLVFALPRKSVVWVSAKRSWLRSKSIVAVEALEGTDAAIERGGKLARPGFVVVKVSKPQQDLRFDVPAVGVDTVRQLHETGGTVLAVEAGKTILLEKEALLKEAELAFRWSHYAMDRAYG